MADREFGEQAFSAEVLKQAVKQPIVRELEVEGKQTKVAWRGFQADYHFYGGEPYQRRVQGAQVKGELKGTSRGLNRLRTVVEHLYTTFNQPAQEAILKEAHHYLQEAQIDPADPDVSLFRFFELGQARILETVFERRAETEGWRPARRRKPKHPSLSKREQKRAIKELPGNLRLNKLEPLEGGLVAQLLEKKYERLTDLDLVYFLGEYPSPDCLTPALVEEMIYIGQEELLATLRWYCFEGFYKQVAEVLSQDVIREGTRKGESPSYFFIAWAMRAEGESIEGLSWTQTLHRFIQDYPFPGMVTESEPFFSELLRVLKPMLSEEKNFHLFPHYATALAKIRQTLFRKTYQGWLSPESRFYLTGEERAVLKSLTGRSGDLLPADLDRVVVDLAELRQEKRLARVLEAVQEKLPRMKSAAIREAFSHLTARIFGEEFRLEAEGERSPWQVLGVAEDADQKTVQGVYRKLARIYHTDGDFPNNDKFREIDEAYKKICEIGGFK